MLLYQLFFIVIVMARCLLTFAIYVLLIIAVVMIIPSLLSLNWM